MKSFISPQDIEFQLSNLKQITFEVTDSCNLKCKYCGYGEFYEDFDERSHNFLSVEKAKLLIDYLVGFWNSRYNISAVRKVAISFYGGEPLLNMNFIKLIVNYLEKLNCKNRVFNFSMTTNAILLDKYMDYLVENNFSLLISLDGNSENNSYRIDKKGFNTFEKIVENVNILKNKYPDYFIKHVNFNAVLHNRNSVEEIHRFFKKEYNKIPSIGELNNMGIKLEKQAEFMQTYKNSYESLRQSEHYEEIERDMVLQSGTFKSVILYIHQYSGFVYSDYNELLYGKEGIRKIPTGTCLPFQKKMFITVNGKILPCERIGHQFSLGQVTAKNIELDFESIAQKYNFYLHKMDKQCNKCYIRNTCVQCIFNLKNIETTPLCWGFMNETDFKKYEETQLNFLEKNPEAYYHIMDEIIYEN